MKIANPIYDVVFRYLMDDEKVAKLLLSAIIGETVIELDMRPTENAIRMENIIKNGLALSVARMDFSAKIRNESGRERIITIELQKAQYFFQIMRFRRYLSKQYGDIKNSYKIESARKKGHYHRVGIPIFPIYILGDTFTTEEVPVLRINRNYIDVATKKRINERHEFIESLTHDAVIIQIPYLAKRRRTDLEQLLAVFDQDNIDEKNQHFMKIKEEDYPSKYQGVIRRLKRAAAEETIVKHMDIEDEIVDAFRAKDEEIEEVRAQFKEAKKKVEEEKEKLKEERKKTQEEKRKAQEAEQKAKKNL